MADPAVHEMASRLAEDCLNAQRETGNDRLFVELAQVLGASSQTLEEAFLTAVRTRMAELAGRRFLEQKLEEHRAGNPD